VRSSGLSVTVLTATSSLSVLVEKVAQDLLDHILDDGLDSTGNAIGQSGSRGLDASVAQ